MIDQLESPHVTDSIRRYLVERILQDVQAYENQVQRLRATRTPTTFDGLVERTFKCHTNNLPSRKYPHIYADDGELVESIPADVFQRLADTLLPTTYGSLGSNASGVDILSIFEAAESLRDKVSR